MKKSISQIKETIKKVADKKREDADHGGEMSAARLESELDMFIRGVKSICDFIHFTPGVDDEIEIPKEWGKYFITEDPEYYEYQRLKKKFEN